MCLMCFKVNACVLALYRLCIQYASEARVHPCLPGTAVTHLHLCASLKNPGGRPTGMQALTYIRGGLKAVQNG